jgi:hypothetical protein
MLARIKEPNNKSPFRPYSHSKEPTKHDPHRQAGAIPMPSQDAPVLDGTHNWRTPPDTERLNMPDAR